MKISVTDTIAGLTYLPDRTPEMGHTGKAEEAFARLSEYRDGAIYVGFYSGSSDWERHPKGDEIVMVLEGNSTVVLLTEGQEERVRLETGDLVVVPANVWHMFEGSEKLKVLSVTPDPTDNQLKRPDT
jgi:mannose-6-phosphate isomerase-like protein (cupin superfamily)